MGGCSGLGNQRQANGEAGATGAVCHGDLTAHVVNDSVACRQAQTCALVGRLGSEKWIEDTVEVLGCHTAGIILNVQGIDPRRQGGADTNRTRLL